MENQASAASSSSASSCSASSPCSNYDVFINHRGPDVKNAFAAHLYLRLVENGLRVFLDKPELMPGHSITSQILAAIEGARVHVAIFSRRYAESTWCLDELDHMVKSSATILPVFYKIKPSTVGGNMKKGAYAKALRQLEQKKTVDTKTGAEKPRYASSTIQNWRNALSHAAKISGFELEGDEDELLRKVVQGVLQNVPKPPLEVAEYPTGVEEKFQELQEKLREFEMKMSNEQKRRMRAQVVGIVGFGGLGKTTLAKLFFNRKRSHYKESSFLFDVRETAARKSLSYLQNKLLRDLKYNGDTEIDNPEEGKVILKRHISSCHVLVIIDDVDDATQLKSLVPMDSLTPESLVLVTTRDTHVLIESGVSSIYKMTELNMTYSKELFCSYAFHQSLPPTEFAEPVDRFVTACNGLPLSLKVIGALLCGNNVDYWEEQFDRLQKTLPSKILDRLRISYDSLCPQDQEIFLDIGCFLIGEKRDRAVRICGLVGIQNLENKCLLEVDSENKLRMHDHIRDCARSIAEEESMPRRLWYQTRTNVMDALLEKSSSVEIEVRGISTMVSADISNLDFLYFGPTLLSMPSSRLLWEKYLFNKFSNFCGIKNLRLVATEGAFLEAILRKLYSPRLSWLRWFGCSCSSLPDWIPMKNLRVLEVQGDDMKSLWPQQSEGPLELRELSINAPLSNLPKSIGQLQHLEWIRITATRSASIQTLPEEFCHLRSLKYLELRRFSKLISLPDSFGKLTNLQHISLEGASSLQRLPNSFGNLTRLKYLCLDECINLTISNGALANIAKLEYLGLQLCLKVKELPPQVAHQRSLKQLMLTFIGLKELPCCIGELCNLEILVIGNPSLKLLPSSLCTLKSLKSFSLHNSPKVKCLPDSFGMLTQLRELQLSQCGIEYLPQDLPKFNNLERIIVRDCPLREVSFKCMFGLTHLLLSSPQILEVAFSDGVCPNLEDLDVSDCSKLKSIQGLGQLTKLGMLNVRGCYEIEELPGVEHCMSLWSLDARNCPKLRWGGGVLQQLREQINVLRIEETD